MNDFHKLFFDISQAKNKFNTNGVVFEINFSVLKRSIVQLAPNQTTNLY